MNSKVDEFISGATQWRAEFEKLRTIVLECQLTEDLKWGVPCYTYDGGNVVLIHGFKEDCALLFPKVLIQQTESTQAARQIRFTTVGEIAKLAGVVKEYIHEAIEAERAGLKVDFKETREFPMPGELKKKLDEDSALKSAFFALTPGRQRAYLLHFSAPKQSKTRESRIEKLRQHILDGKGLNDR